jgi:fumarate reductase iron-sulfur subunit
LAEKTITLSVTRYDPTRDEAPRQQDYTIPYSDDMVVLDGLNRIKNELDGSLTFRWSCRMGICGSCGMSVNGTPKLTCSAFLRDYYPGPVTIRPLANFPILRDLVIDMEDFLEKLGRVKPWIIRQSEAPLAAGEHRQTTAQIDQFRQFSSCINCMLCYSACPVYGLEPEFLGPAAIALARRYNMDSRDEGAAERLPVIASSAGIWECTFVGECSVVCPKGVDPAKAIQQSKVESTTSLLLPFGAR